MVEQSLFNGISHRCDSFIDPPWRLSSAKMVSQNDVRQFVRKCRQIATLIH
jgi:hypothetical protein